MSLLQMIQQVQQGKGVENLGRKLGLDPREAGQLTEMFAPAIGTAAKQRATEGGLDDLLGSLMGEAQSGLFEDPSRAAAPEEQMQGMHFLKTLMGGEEAPQALAEEAAGRTGIDPSLILQFLPALAAVLQGGMQKNLPDSEIQTMQGNGLGGLVKGLLSTGQDGPDLGTLAAMLDDDGDSAALGDILGRFMR